MLYQIETGQPVTEELVTGDGLHYRIFKKGVVAVNPTDNDASVEIEREWPVSLLEDVYSSSDIDIDWLTPKKGTVTLSVPPQSGRVYIFKPSSNAYVRTGLAALPPPTEYTLTIETTPALGKTRFSVDGIPLWTHSGRYTTEYVKGPNYGKCTFNFDKPGTHIIEVLDVEKKALVIADDYWQGYELDKKAEFEAEQVKPGETPRLGKLMDPADPAKLMEGDGYVFEGWEVAITSKDCKITTLFPGLRRGKVATLRRQ